MSLVQKLENFLTRRSVMFIRNEEDLNRLLQKYPVLMNHDGNRKIIEDRKRSQNYPFAVMAEGLTQTSFSLICGDEYKI